MIYCVYALYEFKVGFTIILGPFLGMACLAVSSYQAGVVGCAYQAGVHVVGCGRRS